MVSTVRVKVTESSAQAATRNPGGHGPTSVSLASLQERHGKADFILRDPFRGQEHRISLQPWANADPQNTYIQIDFEVSEQWHP